MGSLSRRRRSAGVRRRLLVVVIGLVLLVVAGPTLVGLTPLAGSLIASQLPAEAGQLSAGSTSLSWMGPLSVGGLELRDPQGVAIASVERIEVCGGLLGVLAGGTTPLEVRVTRPRVDLVVTPDGTNFDAVIAAVEEKAKKANAAGPDADPATTPRRPLTIEVIEAAARITDGVSGDSWLVDGVGVELNDPGRGIDAIELSADGKLSAVVPDGSPEPPRGEFAVRLGAAEGGNRLASVTASGVPLSLVDPFVKRADPTAAVTGTASVEGQAEWRPNAQLAPTGNSPAEVLRALAAGGVRSSGAAQLADVTFLGKATDGGPILLSTIDMPWRFSAAGDSVAIQQLDLTSSVGRATVTGSVQAAEVDRWSAGVAAVPRDLRVAARLDFGRLAAVAPQLVRLQDDARIDSGRIDVQAECRDGKVAARVVTEPMAGVAGGRRVRLGEPVNADVVAVQLSPQAGLAGWTLESLDVRSAFARAEATGDANQLTGTASFDLDRLARDLSGVVDLGGARMEGRGSTRFRVERDPGDGRWQLDADGSVSDLFVGSAETPIAREPNLRFVTRLAGSLEDSSQPPAGTLSLDAGDDRLDVALPGAETNRPQPFEVSVSGDVTRWYRRAAVAGAELPPPEAIALEGTIDLKAAGLADANGGRCDRFNVALTGFGIDTTQLSDAATVVRLGNERIELSGKGNWGTRDLVVQVNEAEARSSVASARARGLRIDLRDVGSSEGEATYKVDLARLSRWLPSRTGPARYAMGGVIDGTARLRGVPEGLSVTFNSVGERLLLVDRTPDPPDPTGRAKTVWSDPRLRVEADVMVLPVAATANRPATYTIDIRDARVASDSLTGSFGGRVNDVVAMRGVELGGGVDYDLEKLTPMLWPQLGDGIRLVGKDRATFRLESNDSVPSTAPVASRFRSRVNAPWQGANLFGMPVGPGQLAATLEQGTVRVDPIDVAIGDGRLTASGAATLDPPPGVVSLQPGPLLTNVAMSPEVNERVLKFIAPVLADATRIDGRYSLSLRELAMPIGSPERGRAAGVLDIQRVRVTPGPTTMQIIGLVKQIEGLVKDGVQSVVQPADTVLVSITDTPIEFQMIDGKVYHRGLKFYVGDALVESGGAVGTDESLDLLLTVPILDKWIDRRPQLLGGLRGQSLRIPVQGTFSKPRINDQAFRQLSRQLLQSAGAGLLEGLLRKALE
ncbi:MAG: hypothetical protein AAF266_00675 [Planctomycetota bacterium]